MLFFIEWLTQAHLMGREGPIDPFYFIILIYLFNATAMKLDSKLRGTFSPFSTTEYHYHPTGGMIMLFFIEWLTQAHLMGREGPIDPFYFIILIYLFNATAMKLDSKLRGTFSASFSTTEYHYHPTGGKVRM